MKNTFTANKHNTIGSAFKLFLSAIGLLLVQSSIFAQANHPLGNVSGIVGGTTTPQMFYARSYVGKCLDFGAAPQVTGSPVFLSDCNGTSAQQIRVAEINDRHEVRLYLGTKVLGVKQSSVNSTGVIAAASLAVTNIPLELQDPANLNTSASRTQIFALDGDSIIWAENRDMVVKVQNAFSANRTPLVLGQRHLTDDEFWDFTAIDGSTARPTTGFVRVPQDKPFVHAYWEAKWGTVIEIDGNESINLQDYHDLPIPAGVTIRGNRRGTSAGAELHQPSLTTRFTFQIQGSDVRITGLRLRGPSDSKDSNQPDVSGILVTDNMARTLIDHNEIYCWTQAAVEVRGEDGLAFGCGEDLPISTRPRNVRVVRNFIHDNKRDGGGYGVVVYWGSYAYIEGNMFLRNRHAIATDGTKQNGYSAWFNLVSSDTPCYDNKAGICNLHQSDFDVHGSDPSKHHTGGYGGSAVEIARNTFLGTNRLNFDIRGQSCEVNLFHSNVTRQSMGAAIRWFLPLSPFSESGSQYTSASEYPKNQLPSWLKLSNNQFSTDDPTDRLAVGDFDGDCKDDLFIATGVAWYYSSGGVAEWRLLNKHTEKNANLMFGDFDGDNRTDVFTQHGNMWDVSWGGISPWQSINGSGPLAGNAAIGDFNGDGRDDVFYADGTQWYVSYSGTGYFLPMAAAAHRVSALRFGDLNGDGKTDVFGVVGNYWMVVYGGSSYWAILQPKLTNNVANLVITDFNGDGRADIAMISSNIFGTTWKVSHSGMEAWTTPRYFTEKLAALGRFAGTRSTDLLLWRGDLWFVAEGGNGVAYRICRQGMR